MEQRGNGNAGYRRKDRGKRSYLFLLRVARTCLRVMTDTFNKVPFMKLHF